MTENGRSSGNRIDFDVDVSARASNIPTNKQLDANKYATKKTIAQGMLDIALLTANASQLKYVLQLGHRHEFYQVMIVLISSSIVLQIFVAVLSMTLNFMRDCRLHLDHYRNSATTINYISLASVFVITVLNVVISAFDPAIVALT